MQVVRICAFTNKGNGIVHKIIKENNEIIPIFRDGEKLNEWVEEGFRKHTPIVFVGACGIAVRSIAPFVKDKTKDSPVVVIDELGKYAVPILSGHLGGANELAIKLANTLGGQAVITTATDINGMFAVDVFAKKNGLSIINRDGIGKISGRILNGGEVTMAFGEGIFVEESLKHQNLRIIDKDKNNLPDILVEDYYFYKKLNGEGSLKVSNDNIVEEKAQGRCITLVTKPYVVGMGCKKGKTFDELNEFLKRCMYDSFGKDTDIENIICEIASIDKKAQEIGLLELAQYYHVPYNTYSSERLSELEGDFSESNFVNEVVGVSNVCERAAACGAGEGAIIIMKKNAYDGMTCAIAMKKTWIIT